MSPSYLGEIRTVGFNFAPVGWLACQGQLLAISEYDALYVLLGTTYGGDGVQTFGLPNLQSRVLVGAGAGPGLSPYVPGQTGGSETVTLITSQLPPHDHPFAATAGAASGGTATNAPAGAYPGTATDSLYSPTPTTSKTLAADSIVGTVRPAGGSQPHNNIQPVLALNYIIAVTGAFPSPPQ